MRTSISLVSLGALIAFAAGCASVGYKQAHTTSISLQNAAQSIDETIVPLNEVVTALGDLLNRPGDDITAQFETYSAAVNELEDAAKSVGHYASQMQVEGDSYFQSWEMELAKIQSNDIQARSRSRKIESEREFRSVSDRYLSTRNELTPFVSGLVDIRTALATDLTQDGLDSLDGLLKRANRDADSLRKSMLELSSEFKAMGVSLSSDGPSA